MSGLSQLRMKIQLCSHVRQNVVQRSYLPHALPTRSAPRSGERGYDSQFQVWRTTRSLHRIESDFGRYSP